MRRSLFIIAALLLTATILAAQYGRAGTTGASTGMTPGSVGAGQGTGATMGTTGTAATGVTGTASPTGTAASPAGTQTGTGITSGTGTTGTGISNGTSSTGITGTGITGATSGTTSTTTSSGMVIRSARTSRCVKSRSNRIFVRIQYAPFLGSVQRRLTDARENHN